MPKYTEKDIADLAWNRIRREVQARATLASANWREEKLNVLLPALQIKFENALHDGALLELDADTLGWVNKTLGT